MPGKPDPGELALYIDAALFLGMHSSSDGVRIACKAFFAAHLTGRLVMSLEEVGLCDSVVWGYPRDVQDAYYPFMDNLHTLLDIGYEGYDEMDIRAAFRADAPRALPVRKRLLLGMIANRKGVLHTADPLLPGVAGLPVRRVVPVATPEPDFPEPLESLYRASLRLRLPPGPLEERR